MVLRVLFDTYDILFGGYKYMKCNSEHNNSSNQKSHCSDDDRIVDNRIIQKKELKMATKKVEYLLSWTVLYWDMISENVVNELKVWMDDWILKDDDRLQITIDV